MHLLRALDNFPKKRATRLNLPEVTELQKACAAFTGSGAGIEDRDERRKRILVSFNSNKEATLERRDIRFIATAIGNSEAMRESAVKSVLRELDRRRDSVLLRSAFTALLASYPDPNLRSLLRSFVARHVDALKPVIRSFTERSGILKGDEHLAKIARDLARSPSAFSFCISMAINSSILASNYGTELKLAAIRDAVKESDTISLQNFLDWVFSGMTGTPAGEYYEAMLSPFETEQPSHEVQTLITSTLVSKFRDPRIHAWPGLIGKEAALRREACLSTIKRWLSIEYLDLFIKIIEATAVDSQFRPRKTFWLKYFDKGVISEVTLVLAADANRVAHQMRKQMTTADYMHWAKLRNTLGNQSVLLMRLGDLIIAEWSHSGAMRFWKSDDISAPQFNSSEYLGNL